jgi:FkbM family methyltransferase
MSTTLPTDATVSVEEAARYLGISRRVAYEPACRCARLPVMRHLSWRLREVLRRVGFDLVRYPSRRLPELQRFRLLRELGIDLVVDVGANRGQYAASLRDGGYRGRIISFEPGVAAFQRLEEAAREDPDWEIHRLALTDSEGEATLNIAANEGMSSSLLEMCPAHEEAAPHAVFEATETVTTRRLDDLELGGERVFLKMDVQGAELMVLAGATRFLDRVCAIEAEVSLTELYAGQPLLDDFATYARVRGFVLTHLEEEFNDPRTSEILAMNGIFTRV